LTRQKRGKGAQRSVASTTHLPKNWRDFLQMKENKTESFNFLLQQITSATTDEGKAIYATNMKIVLRTNDYDMTAFPLLT